MIIIMISIHSQDSCHQLSCPRYYFYLEWPDEVAKAINSYCYSNGYCMSLPCLLKSLDWYPSPFPAVHLSIDRHAPHKKKHENSSSQALWHGRTRWKGGFKNSKRIFKFLKFHRCNLTNHCRNLWFYGWQYELWCLLLSFDNILVVWGPIETRSFFLGGNFFLVSAKYLNTLPPWTRRLKRGSSDICSDCLVWSFWSIHVYRTAGSWTSGHQLSFNSTNGRNKKNKVSLHPWNST